MMQITLALVLVAAGADGPRECANAPSRISDAYWDYVEACGCANLEAPSRASNDYERFMKACSRWRERNPEIKIVTPVVAPEPTPVATPVSRECANPPSRISDAYWDYVDACGCSSLDPPPSASNDYKRYVKACSDWRQRNPVRVVPAPAPEKKGPPTASKP
jgi:hypothetical protein